MNQSARQMLAGLPVLMAEGGAVEDPLSAGRRRAIANGNEAGWLQNVAKVANTWLANPGTAAEAYDAMVKSGISVKDLRDAGIAQDAINTALSIPTPEVQKQVNQTALTSMTSTLAQNPTLASEMGARGAEAIYAQARNYVANLQQDGLTPQELAQLRQAATAQGWGYADIRAAGLDPTILFEAPPVTTITGGGGNDTITGGGSVFPDPVPYTPVTVYDADKFAQEQGGEDLYKKGEIALDTAFRESPVRTVSPVTGQYMYTPAAQLRPATGSGFSFKPPVVTSRPRQLLDVGPTASASQLYAQSRQQQDRALRDAFAASNLPMSGANTYYWQSRLRGGDYSPGGVFDATKFGQDFQSWAASQGSGTSGTAGQSASSNAIAQNQQMYDEFGNPLPATAANPLAMAPKMFLNMAPQMFADGGEANARELLDRLKKPEGTEEQVLGAEEPRNMPRERMNARRARAGMEPFVPSEGRSPLERLQRFTSLDQPQDMSLGETAVDIGMGFLPGVGTAQGARDFERARRDDDILGMGLSAASMIPVAGGAVKLGKKAAGSARQMLDEMRWYHGTNRNILDAAGNLDLKVGPRGAVFLTPDPPFADKYALNDTSLNPDDIDRMIQQGVTPPEGAAIYPLRPNVSNTFDINNKDHIAKLKSVVTVGGARKQRWKPAAALIEEKVAQGNPWAAVERLLPDIKAAGFDSAFVEEMGRTNLAVFDPKNVESAVGAGSARQMLDEAAPSRAVQTDTPEFKNWFGNSQLLDDSGKPKVFYHTTAKDFDEFKPGGFDPELSGPAMWFGDDPAALPAAHNVRKDTEGANVMPVYLRMQRPLVMDDQSSKEWARSVFADDWREFPLLLTDKIVKNIKDEGYDGIIFRHGDGNTEYITFDPTQIKSAIGNEGTFDPTNPVITKADGGEVSFAAQMLEKLKNVGKVARKASRAVADMTPMGEMEDYATRTSTLFYPKETELGGEADAMRHMLFQSELANRYGRLPAAVVGALNEYGLGALQGQSPAERRMDLENDEKGREIGLSDMSQEERLREIMEFIDSGKAKTLKESELGYKDGGEVTTEELIAQMDRIGSAPVPKAPQEDPVKTESRGLLDRLNSAFFENVTKPVVGSAVDMTVGLGDIAQLGTKYLAGRAGIETEPFAPVSGRVQEALGVEGYDPYAPAAIGAQLVAGPMARFRSAAAPAVFAATRATVPGSADDMLKRLAGDVAKEGQVYAGAEAGAQIAREVAPDNIGAELVGSMLGGTTVNSAIAVDPRDVSRSPAVSEMASYTPYPFVRGREYPFVGRLDQYVADNIEGTLTKDQFLGQIRPKFRSYDIRRAEQALSDLGGKDKVTASDLLTRLEQVYDPADFKTSVVDYGRIMPYESFDNPFRGGSTSSTGKIGGILLSRGGEQGKAPSTPPLSPFALNQGRQRLQEIVTNRDAVARSFAQGAPGNISILRDIVNELPDSTEQNRLRYYISDLEDAAGQRQSIASNLRYLEDVDNLMGVAGSQFFEPAYRMVIERGGRPPDELLQEAYDLAISRAYQQQVEQLPSQYRALFPKDIDLTGAVSFGDKKDAVFDALWYPIDETRSRLNADIQDQVQRTLTSMEGYMPEFEKLFEPPPPPRRVPGNNPDYYGDASHRDVIGQNSSNISFSRFTEVMAPLPGQTASTRGIYLHEMQSDLLDDIRKKGLRGEGVPELDERIRLSNIEKDKAEAAAQQAENQINEFSRQQQASYNRQDAGEITPEQGIAERAELDAQAAPVIDLYRKYQKRQDSVGARIRSLENAKFQAEKRGVMPQLDEPFPGMEQNPKALQHMMIKNAVAAAVDRGYSFVALTSPSQSAQPQLYERVPQNARDVVKDLGEGFRVVDLTLEGSNGPFNTTAIVWGDGSAEGREAVNRIRTRGVPFAEGGEVTSKPDDIKNLLSYLNK